jgi:hypothetical protein
VLVALRSDPPLMPYRRRIIIRRSLVGPLQLPRSSGTRWSLSNRLLVSSATSVGGRITSLEGNVCSAAVELKRKSIGTPSQLAGCEASPTSPVELG